MEPKMIITSVTTLLTVLIPAYLIYKREIQKHQLETLKYKNQLDVAKRETKQDKLKLDFFNRAMDLSRINPIINSVDELFRKTIADRFLILIAINGKTDFNIVSVIFEQHKTNRHKANAIGTYRNIHIDNDYRKMLKESESLGDVDIVVADMHNCLLKDFYTIEEITHSKIKFLGRMKIDKDNDFVVFSSIATHINQSFSNIDNVRIKTTYEGTIIPNITQILD